MYRAGQASRHILRPTWALAQTHLLPTRVSPLSCSFSSSSSSNKENESEKDNSSGQHQRRHTSGKNNNNNNNYTNTNNGYGRRATAAAGTTTAMGLLGALGYMVVQYRDVPAVMTSVALCDEEGAPPAAGANKAALAGFPAPTQSGTPIPIMQTTPRKKPRLVILGSGWAGLSLVKEIDSSKYDVVVISPRNYFLFTPMLASATVGTVELRSIIEPVRRYCYRAGANITFYEAEATSIDYDGCRVLCKDIATSMGRDKEQNAHHTENAASGKQANSITPGPSIDEKKPTSFLKGLFRFGGAKDSASPSTPSSTPPSVAAAAAAPVDKEDEMKTFDVDYDYLVIAVGSTSSTMGVKGVEQHCHSLKEVWDAKAIREKIMDCFEKANYPGQADAERRRLLSFVVVGGGPTGVEFSAELHDYINKDMRKVFPEIIDEVSITLVQSAGHILNTYDLKVSQYAEERFSLENIKVKCNARVNEIAQKEVILVDKVTQKPERIPYGMCVWSAGIGQRPLVQSLSSQLKHQNHVKALVTDQHLRVNGVAKKNIFAAGDCATVNQPHMVADLMNLFKKYDTNGDGVLSLPELRVLVEEVEPLYPQLQPYLHGVKVLFDEFDTNHNGLLELDEFTLMVNTIDNHVKSLPTTAQCAGQQGKYLGQLFNQLALERESSLSPSSSSPSPSPIILGDTIPRSMKTFQYHHLGSLAYVGEQAAVLDTGKSAGGGIAQWFVWRAAYLSKQFSWRNRILVSFDWVKTFIFGRDISRV
eukprot:TRINITY_DN1978_c0_g1_i2.p1 TRINITY_DN1978_c0_g1~~TRINITY_DN1978_c0_g1_i2.p1  ORF type:complete len:760 (-),score=188.22 TRINITY_DN1978_c0_g1_i2:34-2313(-)